MIAKMKFINMIGPKEDLDIVVEKYLSKYEIQLENTMAELKELQNVSPCMEANPYKESLAKAEELVAMTKHENPLKKTVGAKKAMEIVESLDEKRETFRRKRGELEEKRQQIAKALRDIEPYRNVNHDIRDILHFDYIKYQFGKIPVEYYEKLERYVYDELSTIFYKCQSNKEYIWGVYFVPATEAEKVDAVYASLHFEKFHMPEGYEGTLEEAYEMFSEKMEKTENVMAKLEAKMEQDLLDSLDDIYAARDELAVLSENFEIRRMAAYTHSEDSTFFILCGWMEKKDAEAFEQEVEKDEKVFCIIEEGHDSKISKPPTKLKNPKFFKPFEMFIRMYGLPDYNEFDPTIFVAITYSFIFGAMFGDVGQGFLLFVGGALLYKFKKMDLAAIVSRCGLFSMFFGFMFGSVFGFENIIEAVWLHPVTAMTTVPFIGKLNTVFVIAIAFGMGLVLLTMIFHIINGFKQKDMEAALFDTNGIAGFVFYAAVVAVVALFMTGNNLPAGIVLVVMFVVPLLVMALKEPLAALVEKKSEVMPKEKGMFFVQAFFELFEVLLSYFSNTLSFVRIGAFAVSHAAMMEVVLMLAGAENGGSPNWIVVVLGNLFVCGMEGLIVGIQVLRLQYYEFFSRFYKGGGREFQPYRKVRQ
ncbi:MAG: ATPase [Lachnospiraceae bacterium]|nr:ATPase [Lachnospiraceae bacterium]